MTKTARIELFVRHCYYSKASAHKARLEGFSREKCHHNLLSTLDPLKVNVTFFIDTFFRKPEQGPLDHFLFQQNKYPVVEIAVGNEAQSFLALLDYVLAQPFEDDTIIYFLEDDYLHRPHWVDILLEGFTIESASYVTLFDHADKYGRNPPLEERLFCTKSVHWRSTPSTTNTYAMRFGTLKRDYQIHQEFSLGRTISSDHEKFCALRKKGALLISSIPGFSAHVEPPYLSPCFDWKTLLA